MASARLAAAKTPRALWWLLALLVASIFINYIDRANLSVAAPDLRRELRLSPSDLGLLLGAFFWTYALLQLAAGWVVDRYNVYWAYGFGFLLWSLATALTGFASSFGVLFGLRLALGTGESIAYPAYSRIIACDFPERHRGIANALIDAGSKAGPAIGTMLGFWIVGHFGWRPLFFLLGFGALLWLVPWFLASPRSGSAIAAERPARGGPGFLEIAKKRDAWGTFLVLFCSNYAWYFMLTWLPSYLVEERHFSKAMMTFYGSLPYWGIAIMTITGGWLSDRMIARGGDTSRVRKTFAISGLLLSTLLLPASMIEDQVTSMALLVVGCISYGLFSSNLWAITQTLAGPAAGKWTGMQNCLGNISGVLAPYVTGVILQRTGRFHYAFVAVAVALVIGACSYAFIVGKVQPIRWSERRAGA
ncbi:MAG TPA: MFS transporter [Bryobacteraceae bacterium]